jgi:hypothetical protein
MDKSIVIEKHLIEAWGVWWTQWQKQTKDKMKKNAMSPTAFVNEHLVSSQDKGFLGNTTPSSVITLVLPPR